MKRLAAITILVVLSAAKIVMAQTTTVEVTIQSVKPKEITVAYKTNLGEKTITLDVSRKATITLNGEEATLESLGQGQKATVEYNKELEIVTKIVATGKAASPPELLKVSELEGIMPWLSEDGLTVYWERDETIWTAHRDNPDSYFTDKKELLPGRSPTVSGDGLEMIFILGGCLHVTTRQDLGSSFRRAKPIREHGDQNKRQFPCLSSDGLTLHFSEFWGQTMGISYTTRSSRTTQWSQPKRLLVQSRTPLVWPFVTSDGLTLFCSDETERVRGAYEKLTVWSRKSTEEPFINRKYVEIKGQAVLGRGPRYVAATSELFFCQTKDDRPQIVVIKNFSP